MSCFIDLVFKNSDIFSTLTLNGDHGNDSDIQINLFDLHVRLGGLQHLSKFAVTLYL